MKEKLEKLKELCDLFQSNIKEYKGAKYIKGKPKAPDYSFRIGGNRKFFLEAKMPKR